MAGALKKEVGVRMSAQNTQPREQIDRRELGRRLVLVTGLLLALDLLFLPWHHFDVDLGRFGVSTEGVDLDRSGVQSPQRLLGMLALVLALALVVYVVPEVVGRGRESSRAANAREWFPLFAGPAVLALLLLKLVLEPDFLGIGAWVGVLLGAGLAYGAFALGQEAPAASGTRPTPAQRQQQQRRWLLLAVAGVAVALAVVWQGDDDEQLTLPDIPGVSFPLATGSPAVDSSTTAAAAPPASTDSSLPAGSEGSPPSDPASSPAALGERQTSVEPTSIETAGSITVSATGASPGRQYVLKLARGQADCGSSPLRMGAAVASNEDGSIGPFRAVIPTNTSSGLYFVCFSQLGDPADSTPGAELVVT
ncbi:MAG: hypothetical protein ABR540_19075 [Acidimicrobiales bacterium]